MHTSTLSSPKHTGNSQNVDKRRQAHTDAHQLLSEPDSMYACQKVVETQP